MLRTGYEIEDIQNCINAIINAKITAGAPWSSWECIREFPEEAVFKLAKPIIYVESPVKIQTGTEQQGGGKNGAIWEMIIGAWDDRKTGGTEEINIIGSALIDFFSDVKACMNDATFTTSIAGTSYSSKTLIFHGIIIDSINGPRKIFTQDDKEFRIETTLTLQT